MKRANNDDLTLESSRPNRLGPKAQERLERLKDEMEHRRALGSRYWNPPSEEPAQSLYTGYNLTDHLKHGLLPIAIQIFAVMLFFWWVGTLKINHEMTPETRNYFAEQAAKEAAREAALKADFEAYCPEWVLDPKAPVEVKSYCADLLRAAEAPADKAEPANVK